MKFNAKTPSFYQDDGSLTPSVINNIAVSCNNYLQSSFSAYLYKTVQEFNSDISGFGKYALHNFVTTSDFESYNWTENYRNATFDVSVDTRVD